MKKLVIASLVITSILSMTACNNKTDNILDSSSKLEITSEIATTSTAETTTVAETTTIETVTKSEVICTLPKETSRSMFIWDGTKIIGLTKEGKELTELIIPNGTTEISSESLETKGFRKSKVQKLSIPKTVTKIHNNTFQYCDDLSEVTIADSAKIDSYDDWFVSDHKISKLVLPEGMTSINSAFHINSINTIVIPSTVTTLPECLFEFDEYSAEKHNDMAITNQVEIYTNGDNITTIAKYDNREYIENLIKDKDSNYNSRKLFEDLQKVLLPSYVDNISYYTNDNPNKLVKVILHCDKDSLWDQIFSDASWVTIKYNKLLEEPTTSSDSSSELESNEQF